MGDLVNDSIVRKKFSDVWRAAYDDVRNTGIVLHVYNLVIRLRGSFSVQLVFQVLRSAAPVVS